MADVDARCSLCGGPDVLTASGRCSDCMGVHSLNESSVVSSFVRYEQDPAAQMLLQTAGEATLEQVGEALGITHERVRQIEASALKRRGLSLADLVGDREGVGHGRAPASPERARTREPDEGAPTAGSVSWARAGSIRSRDAGPVPEELYSPEGVRLAEGVAELERSAARIAELLARLPPAPLVDAESAEASMSGAQERTEAMAAITWNGETKSVKQWAEAFSVTEAAIYTRLKRGRNVDGSKKDGEPAPEAVEVRATHPTPGTEEACGLCFCGACACVANIARELLQRVEELEAKLVAAPVDLGPPGVGPRGADEFGKITLFEEQRPDALKLLGMAGVEGAKVVSRTVRGELIWVPAA